MIKIFLMATLFLGGIWSAQNLKDCSTCSTKTIKNDQIKDLSIDEIRLLTNEIFARNGYTFENGRFQEYFSNKNWYSSKKDNKKVVLNEIEIKNKQLFQNQTLKLEAERKELISKLKNFKSMVLSDKMSDLKTSFNFEFERKDDKEEGKLLKEVLKKIDLDDINYYKNSGLYSVNVDNGFVQIRYELLIYGKEIRLRYNWMTHSEIIKDFDEFTDYHSENEFMYEWQFVMDDGKLKYVRLAVAG